MKYVHYLIALLFFRFWTTCPRCHKKFGGHQKYKVHMEHERTMQSYRVVCPKCAEELIPCTVMNPPLKKVA